MGKRGLGLVVAALAVLMAAASTADAAPLVQLKVSLAEPPRPMTVYAHRGGAGLAPENTLGAFRQAQSLWGAKGVWLEMDTQATADNQLVIMHDDTVDRTTNCTGTVISHTLASLAPCDASKSFPGWPSFEPIPTLRDVLTEGRDAGWRLMVEIKDIPGEANFDATGTKVADVLVPLVRATGFPLDRLMIESFWPLALDEVKRLEPRLETVMLTSSTLPSAPPGVGVPAVANMLFSAARGYTVASPDIATADLSPAADELGHVLGRRVVVWTPDTVADIDKARALNVDGVITNRPDVAYNILGG